jgi:hypothetical protein
MNLYTGCCIIVVITDLGPGLTSGLTSPCHLKMHQEVWAGAGRE